MKVNSFDKGMTGICPARHWEEAFPSGNGTLGALVMGEPWDENVILNHEQLFLPLPANQAVELPPMAEYLSQVRQMLREGRYRETAEFYLDKMVGKGFPGELIWTDPFHPAFDLRVITEPKGEVHDYLRSLNFENGEIAVKWKDDRGEFLRRLFVSRSDGAVAMGIFPPEGTGLSCIVKLEEHPGKRHIRDTHIHTQKDWISFYSAYEAGDGGYDGLVRILHRGGTVVCQGNEVHVREAEEVFLLVGIEPFACEAERRAAEMKLRLGELEAHYGVLLERHEKLHQALFRRVTLKLDSEKDAALPNEELMEKAAQGEVPEALIEKVHDFGRYLLISSSGKLPPNLQGVWNGSWTPPWCSDYTLDENVQMMLWQAMPGNLPEAAHSYFNLIGSYLEDWKENAQKFYGCRGILSSIRSTRSGIHRHFNVEYPLQFWTAGAGWLGQLFYDYWLYTGDREFLAQRAVPYMKEVALFYEDFLVEDEEGHYEFNPSYSPENTPSNSESAASINATMDIAVAKELLTNLLAACEELGIDGERLPQWRKMLGKLPPYQVNKDMALKEWAYPALEDDYHHRHSSHLYPVFPGFEVTPEGTPELYRACHRAAELRMSDGIEAITGWGLAHLANGSARLKDGELAYAALCRVIRIFLYPNLFTTHNHGNCFQMDADLGFTAAVMEMLVFSKPGWIELLPALPEKLRKGTLKGMLCRGGVAVNELTWDSDCSTVEVRLTSRISSSLTVKLPRVATVLWTQGKVTPDGSTGQRYRVELEAGRELHIRFRLSGTPI